MVRYILLPALLVLLFGQSCIHGDLADCPPMVNYAVAFSYTYHVGDDERFYDDVKKINLFVFKHDGVDLDTIYVTKTELSPYDRNFNIPLELPVGTYDMVAWGNVLDDQPFHITPDQFVQGETTLAQARLILEKTAGELNDSELEKLFWGEITTEIPLHVNKIDTMPLYNDTKRIRVVLHWDYRDLPEDQWIDHRNVVVRINGTNACYRFHNDREAHDVTYAPFHAPYDFHENDSILKISGDGWQRLYYYADDFENDIEAKVYDFSILRFFQGVPLQLSIEHWYPQSNGQYFITPIVAYDINDTQQGFPRIYELQRTGGISNRITSQQTWTDYYDNYRVDIYITQIDFDTFQTGSIQINDWWKVSGGTDVLR